MNVAGRRYPENKILLLGQLTQDKQASLFPYLIHFAIQNSLSDNDMNLVEIEGYQYIFRE